MPNTDSGYYNDEPAGASGSGGADVQRAKEQTAMLNKNVLGGDVSPGDEVTLKVVAVHGDEVQVCACGGESGGEEQEEQAEPQPQEQSGGLYE